MFYIVEGRSAVSKASADPVNGQYTVSFALNVGSTKLLILVGYAELNIIELVQF